MTDAGRTRGIDEASEHHRKVVSALTRFAEGQIQVIGLLGEVLVELRRPVTQDDGLQRLEKLLERTCRLLSRNLGEG